MRWVAGILMSICLGMGWQSLATPNVAEDVWFSGTVEQAFARGKELHKPLFIYWGAIWCPPCNEIKNQVFSKPRFKELMASLIPVYLDGDTERAQIWGEKLKASGYPTMLVLDTEGHEIMRISSEVNLEEFETSLSGALTRAYPLSRMIELARSGKLNSEDWRVLAYLGWDQIDSSAISQADKVALLHQLASAVPANLKQEQLLLRTKWLSEAIGGEGNQAQKIQPAELKAALTEIFAEKDLKSVRGFIIYRASDVLKMIDPEFKSAEYQQWKSRFLSASALLAQNKELSIDTRLWAQALPWEIYSMEHPDAKQHPKELVEAMKLAAQNADREATSRFDRHAVVSGAAYLLRKVGELDLARQMLLNEIKVTDTPWYYYSALAGVEQEAGNVKQQLVWSEKAKETALGTATKLQWMVSELVLLVREKAELVAPLAAYYDFALALPDGFVGRNGYRAEVVAKNIKPLIADQKIKDLVSKYRDKCGGLSEPNAGKCREHFASLQL